MTMQPNRLKFVFISCRSQLPQWCLLCHSEGILCLCLFYILCNCPVLFDLNVLFKGQTSTTLFVKVTMWTALTNHWSKVHKQNPMYVVHVGANKACVHILRFRRCLMKWRKDFLTPAQRCWSLRERWYLEEFIITIYFNWFSFFWFQWNHSILSFRFTSTISWRSSLERKSRRW